MPNYKLSGLSPGSFEHLIQSLFLKVVGPGGIIFGAGPDGGREATYEGKMTYPSPSEPWNGYLVLQAKFLQNSLGGPKKDGEWVLDQLRAEVAKFKDPKRKLRQPDYYLLATNVNLTSVWKKGTKDRIYQELTSSGLPIRDARVWDFDQIGHYLDDAPGIRQTYAAWITSGDVLAKVIESLGGFEPDFDKAMAAYLQKSLKRDQHLRLDQSGVSGRVDTRIPIERVFVDLPASVEELSDPPEGEKGKYLPPGFASELLRSAANKCDVTALRRQRGEAAKGMIPGRIVLVGGPGQGKTTLSQFLCQLHRAALLLPRKERLDPSILDVLEGIQAQGKEERIDVPTARRYPVRLDISKFAEAIAEVSDKRVYSALEYLAQDIERVSTYKVQVESLRRWFGNYPWLLILDGLDEVPASANRTQVVQSIRDLLIDVANENGDVFVMITTRRQGYKGDFEDHFQHWFLSPLSTVRALHCARRFTSVQMGEQDREKVMKDLAHAAESENTARLMRSPLQVTIMATLAQTGSVPDDRWTLFSEYYRTIYDREVSKGLWQVLKENRRDIDHIHNSVALRLQIESERTHKTDARLTTNEFSQIVSDRLKEWHYKSEDVERLKTQIVKAASERLVFLVGVEADRVGFEIRSLQEFMAARALVYGEGQVIIQRLQQLAAIPHWRNTILFAAGYIFNEREWLGDLIIGMCIRLNTDPGDRVCVLARAGSQLALDMVEAGIAARHPKYLSALNEIASALIERPISELHSRLACLNAAGYPLLERLNARIKAVETTECLGAWRTVLGLIERGVPGAAEIGDFLWPRDTTARLSILQIAFMERSEWILKKAVELCRSLRSDEFDLARSLFPIIEYLASRFHDPNRGLVVPRGPRFRDMIRVPFRDFPGFDLNLVSARSEYWQRVDKNFFEDTSLKLFLEANKQFAQHPSQRTLSEALITTAPLWRYVEHGIFSPPWPVSTALLPCSEQHEWRKMAEGAAEGLLGSADDWDAAEARWREGVAITDLLAFNDHHGKLGGYLRYSGVPFGLPSFSRSGPPSALLFEQLFEAHLVMECSKLRRAAALMALFIISKHAHVTLDSVVKLIESSAPRWIDLEAVSAALPVDEDRLGLCEYLGVHNFGVHNFRYFDLTRLTDGAATAAAFVADPSRTGLLPVMRAFAQSAEVNVPIPLLRSIHRKDETYKAALTVVTAAQKDLDVSTASWIVLNLCEPSSCNEERACEEALAAARAHVENPDALAALAIGLIDRLPSKDCRRAAAFDTLDDVLRRRTSDLSLLSPI